MKYKVVFGVIDITDRKKEEKDGLASNYDVHELSQIVIVVTKDDLDAVFKRVTESLPGIRPEAVRIQQEHFVRELFEASAVTAARASATKIVQHVLEKK